MPMPENQQTVETAGNLVKALHGAFGAHPGYRATHAKGKLVTGTFKPSAAAASLSKALHFNQEVPITSRFSSSTGIPRIPDTDSNGDPRGFAIRFHYPDADGKHVHTDIIGHSVPFFPSPTGEEFLKFLTALGEGKAEEYIGSHPSAGAFVSAPKPTPTSFATEPFFSLNAIKLVNADGKETYVRYRFVPEAGHHTLNAEELKSKSDDFLYEELPTRLSSGPIKIKLTAQVAEEGDPTNDVTKHWPEERKVVELGEITINELVPEEKQFPEQKHIIFDPVPRVDGVEPSDDPLLDMRAAIYLISGRERRSADVSKPE